MFIGLELIRERRGMRRGEERRGEEKRGEERRGSENREEHGVTGLKVERKREGDKNIYIYHCTNGF